MYLCMYVCMYLSIYLSMINRYTDRYLSRCSGGGGMLGACGAVERGQWLKVLCAPK